MERVNPLLVREIGKYAAQAKSLDESAKIESSLKGFIFRKLLQPLYLNYKPRKTGTVFFLSTISSDGIGDFVALNKSAQLFKEQCPEFTVKIGCTYLKKLPEWPNALEGYAFRDPEYLVEKIVEGLELPDFQLELRNVQELLAKNVEDYETIKAKSTIAAEALEEYHHDLLAASEKLQKQIALREQGIKFYQELVHSKAIVNISLALNTFGNPLLKDKSLYFSEAGNFQGIGHAQQLNWYSMGLLPCEEGIFLKQPASTYHRKIYVSYMTTISHAKLCYIYLICQLQKVEDINILLYPLTEEEIASLNVNYLASLGISLIKVNNAEIKTGAEAGRTLYLRQDLPMAYDEFHQFLQQSLSPIGCTGDLSLSEVMGFGKIPFYELRPHKIETIDALKAIASFLHANAVHAYLTDLKNLDDPIKTAIKLAASLGSANFETEWKAVSTFINCYYSFENSLLATLKAFFAYQDMPNWKQEEQRIQLESRSAKEVYSRISQKLKTAS